MPELSVYEKQLKKKQKTGISRLMEIAGTKSAYLVLAGLLSIFAVIAQITPYVTVYLLVKELVANISNIQAINTAYVWRLGWITIAGIGIFGVLTYASGMLSHVAAFNILYEIRVGLAGKLTRMPMGYFTSKTNGSIKKILHEDVERIELFVAHHVTDIVQAAVLPVISLIFLFYIDWRLAIGVLIPLPLAMVAQTSMYGSAGMKLYKEWQEKLAAMNGTIVEYVRGMPVVKIFNQTVSAFKRFSDDVYAYRDLTLYWVKTSATSFTGLVVLISSSAVFVLPIVIYLLHSAPSADYGTMVSTVFLFLFVGMGISLPLYKLLYMASSLSQIRTGLEGIDGILNSKEIPDPEKAKEPYDSSVKFNSVSFAYGAQTVLNDVSFSAAPGTVTALVGPSGGGKTTIANLIGRFWDVETGEVSIGGVNIKDMPVENLNNMVSTVFQDVFLFFDTIEENIRMGNKKASFEEVVSAAKAAQIHDFIETLPEGYKTLIGEGGTYLSGGEQQRISLARIILKDSPIIVLDEATAYADPENEAHIQDALSIVLKDKTVIVIAHRLYTITDADRILVVNEGRIEEEGTHGELLEKKGLYGFLWDIHTKARDWNIDTDKEDVS
ncbi:MAG: ABC transporter ATP-binding protein [Spirochaetales bacterium]|nr:ABC transporter ATP-binding protein [Spirochaetales bacterium]